MKIRRYYVKQNIELAEMRGIHGILVIDLKWQIAENTFVLYYPAEDVEIDNLDDLPAVVGKRGKPNCVFGRFKSVGYDSIEIETCGPDVIVISVDSKGGAPDDVFTPIELMLALKRITERPVVRTIRSAFIAHVFDDEGEQYEREVSHFLQLLDIRSESGMAFSPERISDQVRERLTTSDMFVAIITPQDDSTWLKQECIAANLSKKPVFILKREDVEFKLGLLGDLRFLPFPKGQISKTFVHILEGIVTLRSESAAA